MELIREQTPLGDDVGVIGPRRGLDQPRSGRRLTDKLMICFHQACDGEDLEVAQQLLHVLEMSVTQSRQAISFERRKNIENLVAAHERLWLLRNRKNNAY